MDFFWERLRGLFRKIHGYVIPTRHNAYRPRLLHTSWLIFFLALILTSEAVLLTNVFAGQSARDYLAAVLPLDIVELTNLERGFNNVATVKENSQLTAAAEAKARDMAEKSYFAHTGPDGKEPWAWINEAGYRYGAAGENLAVRFNESADVVEAWMASPGHRANMVKPTYSEIGVGVAQGVYKGAPAMFVVQYFGRPSAAATAAQTAVVPAVEEQSPQVLGAAAEAQAKEDAVKLVAGVGAVPTVQAFSILAGAAAFMIVIVLLTFVVNPQVQPVDLLLGGGGVAVVAVALLILNFSFVGPVLNTPQAANVIGATQPGVLVGEDGAFTPLENEGIEDLPPADTEGTLNS